MISIVIKVCFQVREGVRLKLIYNLLIYLKRLSLRISFEFTIKLYCRASLDVFLFIENCENVEEEIYRDGNLCHYALLSSALRRSFEVKNTTQSSKTFQVMILAVGNAILAIAFRSLKKSGP